MSKRKSIRRPNEDRARYEQAVALMVARALAEAFACEARRARRAVA